MGISEPNHFFVSVPSIKQKICRGFHVFASQVEYQCCPQQLVTESLQLAVDVDPQKQVALGQIVGSPVHPM